MPTDFVDPDQLRRVAAQLERVAQQLTELQSRPQERAFVRPPTAAFVRSIIRTRRARVVLFGRGIFADPAWDMLLDLYAASLEGRRVSVSSLCAAAEVPPTTALRWIKVLQDRQVILRTPDPSDARRVYIELDAAAVTKIEQVLLEADARSLVLI